MKTPIIMQINRLYFELDSSFVTFFLRVLLSLDFFYSLISSQFSGTVFKLAFFILSLFAF